MVEIENKDRLHIGREPLAQARRAQRGVDELLHRHWEEIAFYKDVPLDVNWEVYERLDREGKLRIYTVRDGERLVGYAVYMLLQNAHYRGFDYAQQDVLFLAPEYRRGTAGLQLIAYADVMLKAEGLQATYHHSKVQHPIDLILRRLGYDLVERVWAKRHDRD